jgi:hypothetical protein
MFADQQGPLQSFDEADLNTAEMALLANPDEQEPKTEGAALLGRLALQRRLSSIKRWLMKVGFSFLFSQGGIHGRRPTFFS